MISKKINIGFPATVNNRAARIVAGGVALLAIATLITGWTILLALLALGFWLRVWSGPTFSPLGQLATRVLARRWGPAQYVPGEPKRFAQLLGALTTSGALALALLGFTAGSQLLLAVIVLLASAEAVLGRCLGCWLFNKLILAGVIPGQYCPSCQLERSKLS